MSRRIRDGSFRVTVERPPARTSYRAILGDQHVRRLLLTSLLSRLPSSALPLAIILMVAQKIGSYAVAGGAVAGYSLARAAAAPAKGFLLDKVEKRRLLLPLAVGNALSLVGLVGAAWLTLRLPLIAASTCAGASAPPIAACVRALWPRAAATPEMVEGLYTLDAIGGEANLIVAPLCVGLIVALSSPALAVLVAAGLTVFGTWLYVAATTEPRDSEAIDQPRSRSTRSSPLRDQWLRTLFLVNLFVGYVWGALTISVVATAANLDESSHGALLLALVGLGSMLGGLLQGAFATTPTTARRYCGLLVFAAICILPLAWADAPSLAITFSIIAGLPFAPVLASQYMLVNVGSSCVGRVEAFTWSGALFGSGVAAGSALAGWMVSSWGSTSAVDVAAIVMFAGGIAAMYGVRDARRRSARSRPA